MYKLNWCLSTEKMKWKFLVCYCYPVWQHSKFEVWWGLNLAYDWVSWCVANMRCLRLQRKIYKSEKTIFNLCLMIYLHYCKKITANWYLNCLFSWVFPYGILYSAKWVGLIEKILIAKDLSVLDLLGTVLSREKVCRFWYQYFKELIRFPSNSNVSED